MPIYLQNAEKASTLNQELADKKGMSTYYLTDDPTHYEVQRNNNFVFYVDGLNAKVKDLIPQNKYAAANAEDVLRVSVDSSSVPHFKQSALSLKRGNSTMKFAGVPEFDSHSIKLTDFIGAGTSDILNAWQQLSYNVTTDKVGLASDYKIDAYLLEYTPDYQLVRTIKLIGCWLSGVTEDDFDHNSNDRHTISATVEFDRAFIDTSDIQ